MDGATPKYKREALRRKLEDQACHYDCPHMIIVATKVFESSITRCINGLVNSGMAMGMDKNGNLKVYKCTPAQNKQREGRAGRVFESLYKTLNSSAEEPPTGKYEMPKEDALPLLLESIAWEKSFPIIGISQDARMQYYHELESLGLISHTEQGHVQLTNFGHDVLQHTGDFRGNMVAAICKRFGLPWHDCIASGYFAAQCDCFLIRSLSNTCGLYPDQLAAAHHAGFLPAPTRDVK